MIKMSSVTQKTIWTWQSCLQYHGKVILQCPLLLVSTLLVRPCRTMVVADNVYSTYESTLAKQFPIQLSRIAIADVRISDDSSLLPLIAFAKIYASKHGVGVEVESAYKSLKEEVGTMQAILLRSIALVSLVFSITFNTVDAAFPMGSQREGSNTIFEIVLFLWYIMEVILAQLGGFVLKVIPASDMVAVLVSWIAVLVNLLFVLPIGVIGLVFVPLQNYPPLSSSGYTPIPSVHDDAVRSPIPSVHDDTVRSSGRSSSYDIVSETFEVIMIKPTKDMKVGIRFGASSSGALVIANIREDGLAAKTQLRIGDHVLSINGINVQSWAPKDAASKLTSLDGKVVLVATHAPAFPIDDEDATV